MDAENGDGVMAHSIESHLNSATAIKIAEDNGVDVLHVSEFDDMMLYEISTAEYGVDWSHVKEWDNYTYSLDILCLMALTEALGLEYGGFA